VAREAYLGAAGAAARLLAQPGIFGMIGPRGVGKTWIACALVNEFCRQGRLARYLHVMDYFIGLKETYGDGARTTEGRFEHDHVRLELLVLDEMHERADND
jgi:DNA replication protein DnaC